MKSLQDRLKAFLKSCNLTMQKFEQQSNIAQGAGARLSPKSYATTFKRIADAYPELNIEWLKTGEGEMLRQGAPVQHVSGSTGVTQTGNVSVPGGNAELIAALNRALALVEETGRNAQANTERFLSILETRLPKQ